MSRAETLRGEGMGFTRITNADTTGKGVVGLPDTPGLSTADMQKRFDELALDVIIPKFNALLESLEEETAALSIGAKPPTGITANKRMQSILEVIAATALNADSVAKDAKNTAQNADSKIDEAARTVNQIAYMLDPITGTVLPISQVITSIYDSMRPAPLTADAYAALNLTADEYASYQITAYEYAMYAADLFGSREENGLSWNHLTDKPFGETVHQSICDFSTTPEISFDAIGYTWWKISNLTPSYEQLLETDFTTDYADAVTVRRPKASEFLLNEAACSAFLFAESPQAGFIICYQTGTIETSIATVDVPETGIYFGYAQGATPPATHVISVSYTEVNKLEEKYIPDELYAEIDNRIDAYIEEALGGEY